MIYFIFFIYFLYFLLYIIIFIVIIKNQTYYFFNDMINIKDFDSSLIKIDKKYYKNIGIYNIGYITIKKLMIMKVLIV